MPITITVPGTELFDSSKQEFIDVPEYVLELEHSLVALSKWEAEFEKAFLGPNEKTTEETFGYIRCMCLTPDVPPNVFLRLTQEQHNEISEYIGKKMSATWFREEGQTGPKSREKVTAELIYHWIFALQMPMECQNWHLQRLFTQIRVIDLKNNPKKQKKMSQAEIMARNRQLNAERRAASGSSG